MSEKKIVRRNVAVALGIICIVLVAGLIVAFAYYMPIINDKGNTISSLNAEISQLNFTINSLEANVTYLQEQLNGLLNVTEVPLKIIASNLSAWVNRTVIVEGSLSGPYMHVPYESSPWDYELSSGNQAVGVAYSASLSGNVSAIGNQPLNGSVSVRIYGVVEKGESTYSLTGEISSWVTYYIEAEIVNLI